MLLIYSKVRVFIHVQGKEEIHIFGTIPLRMYKNKRMRQVNKHKNENLDWEKSSIGINTLSQYCSVDRDSSRRYLCSKAQVLAYLLHGFSEFAKRLSSDITPNIDGFQDTVGRLCVFVETQLAMLPQGAAADGCYQCIPLELFVMELYKKWIKKIRNLMHMTLHFSSLYILCITILPSKSWFPSTIVSTNITI